ncbi:uncharacterized protein LOC117315502 isoform X2 [Pecten maximus]|uniref:uncharacterized protein LOC117315502 isoform X2 n=1 Tax=Pecten maximus TaxID=6579 RepID=UPI001457EC80|nr:uncharacterized protein LOC117315502 isoform X2 [Pecten maximus]
MYDFDNSENIPAFGEEVRDAIDNGDIVGLRKALDKGARINMKFGKINDRPLHEAARFGSESVLSFLLEKNADPDVTNNYGNSPLMHCFDTSRFRANGWTKKAQTLLKHGARKDIKNMHSQMALDHLQSFLQVIRNGKNIEREIRNTEELAEAYYLHDVLTEKPGSGEQLLLDVIESLDNRQEQTPTCHGQNFKAMCDSALSVLRNRDWNLPWEILDDVPNEIRQLGTVTEDTFLRSLETKHAQPKYIRLMIVGDVGVGKTSLCLNLIDEDKEAIPTDGINVFIQNYLVDMKTGKWRKLPDEDIQNLPTKLLSTVCRAEKMSQRRLSETTRMKEMEGEVNDEQEITMVYTDMGQASEGPSPPSKRRRNDSEKLKSTLKEVNATGVLRDDDALLSVWDFAGDEIYEATHHIFMSPDAVYIIVFNADACLQDQNNLEKLYTWQEVIRTYTTEPMEKGTSNKTPPIILVGSHLDKLGKTKEERNESKIKLFDIMENISSDNQLYFVDNTNKDDSALQRIRDEIVKLAPFQKNWNKSIPATWVSLDMDLRMLKQQKRYILQFSEVLDIDKRNEVSVGDSEEIKCCLRYMHLTGNILFFENEPEGGDNQEPFVVAHPQWIVDALRCIIKAMRFIDTHDDDSTKLHIRQFQKSGILTLGLLERLWGRYRDHQDILIEIMQRLHLLVAVTEKIEIRKWIVPSLLPPTDPALFKDTLSHPHAVTSKTLCFVFKSKLLPAIYDKLLAICLSSVLKIKKDKRGKALMQRGSACFMINRACDLLMSCTGAVVSCTLINKNGKTDFKRKCSFVRSLLSDLLKEIFTRFHHGSIVYELCLHCKHDVCSDSCPVPISDISTEGRVLCCENCPDDQHWLERSEAEPWIDQQKSKNDSDYKLPDEILDSQPTERMMALLSQRYIGSQYELFFSFLDLKAAIISSHKTPNTELPTIIFNLFVIWRNKKDKEATVREILNGMEFMEIDYMGAADELGKEFRNRSTNST